MPEVDEVALDVFQTAELAIFIKECKIAKKDLEDTSRHHTNCLEKAGTDSAWWQRPEGVIGISVLSFLVGFSTRSN